MADEQIIEQVTRRLTSREVSFFTIGTGIGIAGGFALGYFVAEKHFQTKYEKIAALDIKAMREHYNQKLVANQNLEKPSVEERLKEVVVEERYTSVEQEAIEETEAETRNVFEMQEWDYEIELSKRSPDVPYIIHYDEFRENPKEHTQITCTYYEVDDVLADVRDEMVEDMDRVVGLGNLGHWGHGSNDPNVVYVRNEELDLDIEVCRDPGSFHQQAGRDIRHSSFEKRRRPKRGFDDDQYR